MSQSQYLIPRQPVTRFELVPGIGLAEITVIGAGALIGWLLYLFVSLIGAGAPVKALAGVVPPVAAYLATQGGQQSLAVSLLRSHAYSSTPQRFLYRVGTGGGVAPIAGPVLPPVLAPLAAIVPAPILLALVGFLPGRRKQQVQTSMRVPQSIQAWFPVAYPASGLITRRDGALVAVLRVEPVNFVLKSAAEQARILSGLHEAINALQHPAQILSLPRPIDLDAYLELLRARVREVDPGRQHLLRQYTQYVASLVAGGEALERRFYVLLPQPVGKGASEELRQRAQDLAAALARAGLAAHVLDDRELLDLLHTWSHPAQAAFERPPGGPPAIMTQMEVPR